MPQLWQNFVCSIMCLLFLYVFSVCGRRAARPCRNGAVHSFRQHQWAEIISGLSFTASPSAALTFLPSGRRGAPSALPWAEYCETPPWHPLHGRPTPQGGRARERSRCMPGCLLAVMLPLSTDAVSIKEKSGHGVSAFFVKPKKFQPGLLTAFPPARPAGITEGCVLPRLPRPFAVRAG